MHINIYTTEVLRAHAVLLSSGQEQLEDAKADATEAPKEETKVEAAGVIKEEVKVVDNVRQDCLAIGAAEVAEKAKCHLPGPAAASLP